MYYKAPRESSHSLQEQGAGCLEVSQWNKRKWEEPKGLCSLLWPQIPLGTDAVTLRFESFIKQSQRSLMKQVTKQRIPLFEIYTVVKGPWHKITHQVTTSSRNKAPRTHTSEHKLSGKQGCWPAPPDPCPWVLTKYGATLWSLRTPHWTHRGPDPMKPEPERRRESDNTGRAITK